MDTQGEGGEVGQNLDQDLIRALAHPLRVKILRALGEQPGSPTQLSTLLGEPLVNVAYHTRVLADRNCIELVETRPVRGAVEHIYKARPQATLEARSWRKMPQSVRSGIVGSSLDEFTTRAIDALQSGTFETREGSTFTWSPLTVDEQGWGEIKDILGALEERFQAVGKKCEARLEDASDGASIVVAVAAFEAGGNTGEADD